MRDPKPPFDRLPKLPQTENSKPALEYGWRGDDSGFDARVHSKTTISSLENIWKVAYVDDDTALHQDLIQYLDGNLFLSLTIKDSLNAFSELIDFNPDLILLDADMPNLNGYELCALLRNNQNFATVPIIIVEPTQELVNSSQFGSCGATDQLSKPFNRIQLLSMVQKYLN